jgi:hypothetical protein
MTTRLLKRAYDFISKAPALDFNEDRCVMWAIHLAEDIRAHLIANSISVESADAQTQSPTPKGVRAAQEAADDNHGD